MKPASVTLHSQRTAPARSSFLSSAPRGRQARVALARLGLLALRRLLFGVGRDLLAVGAARLGRAKVVLILFPLAPQIGLPRVRVTPARPTRVSGLLKSSGREICRENSGLAPEITCGCSSGTPRSRRR